MKKILALILVMACILSFAACDLLLPPDNTDNTPPVEETPDDNNNDNNDNNNENNEPDNKEEIPEPDDAEALPTIQEKIDATAPNGAEITVIMKSLLGTLTGTYDVTYNEDGTATVDYSYEKFNSFTQDQTSTELKSTVTGTVTVAADGSVSGDLSADALNAVAYELKLDESKLGELAINAGVLKATVKADDTASVLGVALNYDVQLVVNTGSNGVTSIVLSYTTNVGEVEVVTLYK